MGLFRSPKRGGRRERRPNGAALLTTACDAFLILCFRSRCMRLSQNGFVSRPQAGRAARAATQRGGLTNDCMCCLAWFETPNNPQMALFRSSPSRVAVATCGWGGANGSLTREALLPALATCGCRTLGASIEVRLSLLAMRAHSSLPADWAGPIQPSNGRPFV